MLCSTLFAVWFYLNLDVYCCSPVRTANIGQQQQQYHPQPQREQRDRDPVHPREQQSRDQQPVGFIVTVFLGITPSLMMTEIVALHQSSWLG